MGHFQSFDGVEITYQEWGEPGSAGPPVLLHHGFVADARANWLATGVVPALLAAGRRVIAPDARGHGRSGKPHDPAAYGEDKMARDLGLLVGELGEEEVDLVGYSMGAVVSLLYASSAQTVRRLVVGGVGSGVIECGGVDRRRPPNEAIIAALQAEDPASVAGAPGEWFRTLADVLGADRQALVAQARSVYRGGVELSHITAPTLVLAGEEDPLADRPELLAEAIPDAKLLLLSGDHAGALGDPRFSGAIVEFLG